MIWGYLVPILLVIMIFRWWQLKRSLRNNDYDYSYYEDGPYGKKKRPLTFWEQLKKNLRI